MKDDRCVTVLLTGRNIHFADRIKGILNSNGLFFDEMGFKPYPSTSSTFEFKKKFIEALFTKYPFIKEVYIWEDRVKHINSFQAFLLNINNINKFEVIKVEEEDIFLPEHQEREIISLLIEKNLPNHVFRRTVNYTGLKLDDLSKQKLEKICSIPDGWKKKSDHVTMKMGTIDFENDSLFKGLHVGDKISIKVVAIGRSDKVIAVKVQGIPSVNTNPHITIAGFFFSNQIFQKLQFKT